MVKINNIILFHSIVIDTYNIGNLFFYHRFPAIVICEGVVISAIGILGLVNSFKAMKGLIIAYYVSNLLASIVAIIMLFLSIYILIPLYHQLKPFTNQLPITLIISILFILLLVNVFLILPIAIIASIKAKTILNNINPPLTHDIEMNDIADVDEIDQTTNKSE